MIRIKKCTKAIADAHLAAKESGKFDNIEVNSWSDMKSKLKEGKTFEYLMNKIEVSGNVSITSQLMSSMFNHTSNAYKKATYKFFTNLLQGDISHE